VLDGAGNAVSLTSTVNTYFGSKVVSASTGVLFNNQMDDFSIPNSPNYFGLHPSPLNYPVPGKRPLSSMAPCVVLREGAVRLVGGASGGPRIITATAQVILNTVGRGMDLLSALVAPRMHSQFLPALLELEAQQTVQGLDIACPPGLAQALSDRGQLNVSSSSGSFGVAQFIEVDSDTGAITAVSDPRKDGRPAALDYP
jgi:gamma-glutamyltranspeptidase/glutathione hydrolase/leukotriene-C4 hydrolase